MKRIALVLLSFFVSINIVYASTNTIPRTDDDLGVNKKWIITEDNINNVKRTPRVDASEKIYDFANLLTSDEEQEIYEKIITYIKHTNMDMVIITTDLEYSDIQIEDYAADFYDYNDFGIDFDKYSGILLIRNANNYNRFFNIYTFGEAQAYYDYYRCERILDLIYYDLKNDYYLDGFNTFISHATNYYDKGPDENIYIDEDGYAYYKKNYIIPWNLAIILSAVLTSVIMFILVKKNKMVKKESLANSYIDKNSIKYSRKIDQFLYSHTSSYVVSSSSSGGGSSSHSGSSGGGHGGGGGRHG